MWTRLICLTLLISIVLCGENKRTLVLLDNPTIRESHSMFFKSLTDRGFTLNMKSVNDSNLALTNYGEYLYDNIIIFAPTANGFGGTVSVDTIVKFVDDGGNLLVAIDSNPSDAIRKLIVECGMEVDENSTMVIDHLNYGTNDSGKHTLIVTDVKNLIPVPTIVGSKTMNPFLYRGNRIIPVKENRLVLPVLTASNTACIDGLRLSTSKIVVRENPVLIAALQARNNARVIVSGSLDFFSDKLFTSGVEISSDGNGYKKSGNEDLSEALTKWAFKEVGVLRVVNVEHHRPEEEKTPQNYYVGDKVTYTLQIEKLENNYWSPFIADDIQLELVKLNPLVRTTLRSMGNGVFRANFTLPYQVGVYQFKVDYIRPGYTFLHSVNQVSVHPLERRHSERFIVTAYPYYASALLMMVGLFVFSYLFLNYRDVATKGQ